MLKRVKEVTGHDLYGVDPSSMLEFMVNPVVACEIIHELFRGDFEKHEITVEDLLDEITTDELIKIRAEVDQQMPGFSGLWTTISMALKEAQSGRISPELAELARVGAAISGPSS